MPYVTTWERKWKRDGERIGLLKGKQKGKREGKLEGKREGKLEAMLAIARKMLGKNMPVEVIVECTGLNENEIKGLLY